MPIELPSEPPSDTPLALKELWPLVLRWGASDDSERDDLIDTADAADLQSLVDAVNPAFGAVNDYLDATGNAEHAVPYGDLAQAALEARFELDRRSS